MLGKIKWHRFDGQGYIIPEHNTEITLYFESVELFDKNELVEYDVKNIMGKLVAINVKRVS